MQISTVCKGISAHAFWTSGPPEARWTKEDDMESEWIHFGFLQIDVNIKRYQDWVQLEGLIIYFTQNSELDHWGWCSANILPALVGQIDLSAFTVEWRQVSIVVRKRRENVDNLQYFPSLPPSSTPSPPLPQLSPFNSFVSNRIFVLLKREDPCRNTCKRSNVGSLTQSIMCLQHSVQLLIIILAFQLLAMKRFAHVTVTVLSGQPLIVHLK